MTEKVKLWIRDMTVYGNGIFYVSWDGKKPVVKNIPLTDFYVDPSSTHINRPEEIGYPRYAGFRFLTSLRQLKSETTIDVKTGKAVPKYKNLDKIELKQVSDDFDKDFKERLAGSTLGKEAVKEQVEVIVHYTQSRVIMLANRNTVIFDEETPYKREATTIEKEVEIDGEIIKSKIEVPEIKGFLPFAVARNYNDANLFYAKGDVEIIADSQEALNDISNQKQDNISYTMNNMWQLDPRYKPLLGSISSKPGNVFPIPKGALSPIEKQDVSGSADNEISRLTQMMRSATAADAAVQGTQQRFSRTTATEISAQLNQANMRFSGKMQNIEDEGLAQLARVMFKMVQIFVKKKEAIRIIGKQGVEWQDYIPEDFFGEYEPRVVLQATADAELGQKVQAMQMAAQFSLGNPLVNQQAFLRRLYKAVFSGLMSDDDVEELLTTEQPIMMPNGQPLDPAMQQSNAMMTPGAMDMMLGMGEQNGNEGRKSTFRDRTQSGSQGGGGADSGANNLRRIRADQTGTKMKTTIR